MGVKDLGVVESFENLHIDPAFVLDPKDRPKRKHNDHSSGGFVPVVDLAPLREKTSTQDETAEPAVKEIISQVGQACKDWGFFQVINHGVSLELLEELQTSAKEFFDLPLEEKRKVMPLLLFVAISVVIAFSSFSRPFFFIIIVVTEGDRTESKGVNVCRAQLIKLSNFYYL